MVGNFSEKEWTSMGYEDVRPWRRHRPNLTATTLTSTIHPIFRFDSVDSEEENKSTEVERRRLERIVPQNLRSEFGLDCEVPQEATPRWTFDGKYSRSRLEAVLTPVLQLASLMLTSPASVAFLYSLMYGPRAPIAGLSQEVWIADEDHTIPRYSYRRVTDRSQSFMRQKVEEALRRLKRNIRFEIAKTEEGFVGLQSRDMDNDHIVLITDDDLRMGFRSLISIDPFNIDDLERLHAKKGDHSGQMFNLQFMVALILCHEVVHAISCAVRVIPLASMDELKSVTSDTLRLRACQEEPYLENESVNECGHSWENAVFSGSPTTLFNLGRQPIWILDWPSELSIYRFTRGPSAGGACKWLASMHHLRSIHQQAFWDAVDPEDVDALYFPKSLHIKYQRVGHEPGGYYRRVCKAGTISKGRRPAASGKDRSKGKQPLAFNKAVSKDKHSALSNKNSGEVKRSIVSGEAISKYKKPVASVEAISKDQLSEVKSNDTRRALSSRTVAKAKKPASSDRIVSVRRLLCKLGKGRRRYQ